MSRKKSKRRCAPKVRYSSYDEAALVLVECKIRAALRGRTNRREQQVYYCGECNGFHLTSHAERRAS